MIQFSSLVFSTVCLLLSYGPALRTLMLIFNELGLLNGEYVVVTVGVLHATCQVGDSRDEEACRAYEGILNACEYIPDSQAYRDFTTSVYNRMPEMNYTLNAPNEVCVPIL